MELIFHIDGPNDFRSRHAVYSFADTKVAPDPELERLAVLVRNSVRICDRAYRLRVYKNSFVARVRGATSASS